ncbi:MAG: hypothetical protein LBG58_16465 [Planctomycetaceae bacterium]|jgi:glutaredoxin|nr:hypothetical protein [Planctomycetaceae bacterium]
MRTKLINFFVVLFIFCGQTVLAQYDEYSALDRFTANPFYSDFMSHVNFHSGIHSGSWTIKRERLLDNESKDKYRSCRDPYCNRCSKHLADYGHEYQYLSRASQRQLWYRGTSGSIAPARQFGYDAHGFPYARRGQPAAVMSKEYVRVLNHAIWEQVQARNAVAAEESAEDRVGLLAELRDAALAQLQKSRDAWELLKQSGHCINFGVRRSPCSRVIKQIPIDISVENFDRIEKIEIKNLENFIDKAIPETVVKTNNTPYSPYSPHFFGLCEYCAAKAQFLFDQNYVGEVERELTYAVHLLEIKKAIADEAVRLALLSKPDADKATRFKRIQMKPPKYQEVLAAKEAVQNKDSTQNKESTQNEKTETNNNEPAPNPKP